jgi:hypothetical protein
MLVDLRKWSCGCVGFIHGPKQYTLWHCEGRPVVGPVNPADNKSESIEDLDDLQLLCSRLNANAEQARACVALYEAIQLAKMASTGKMQAEGRVV